MKKMIKILIAILILVVSLTSVVKVEAATDAPATITMGTGEQLSSYIGKTYFQIKVTNDGKYVYCTDKNLNTPNNMEMKLVEAKDAGVTYIMTNGYPAKSITGNAKYDYYITQTALWWYLDDTAGGNNLGNLFKSTGADPYGLREHVINLKEAAKKAKNEDYVKPTVSIDSNTSEFIISNDGKYYYSNEIVVNSTSTTGNIKLELEGAPANTVIVDESGSIKTSVASGSKIRLRVTVENVTSLELNMTLKASVTGKIDKAYMYEPTSKKHQPVVVSVLYSETETINTSKKLVLKTTKAEIIKIDKDTNKTLSGAKLQLLNAAGTVVDTWTTTTSAHTINHLPAGNYTLIELQAPNGYELSTLKQAVTIETGKITKVTFENTKKPTSITILKKDKETDEILPGATFAIKNSKGEVIETWTSTKEGHIISGLPEGEYVVEELNAPSGYIKSEEKYTVTLEAGKPATVAVYNVKEIIEIESVIKISKVNGETGEMLSGATLALKDEKGQIIETWTTTTEDFIIKNVKPGKYYLSEISAPEGFVLSTEVVEIMVTEDGGTVIVTFYNTPIVEVPNTLDTTSKTLLTLGFIATILGGSIILITLRKEEV